MDFVSLGQITVTANDLSVVVGSFSIEEGDDTIWLDIQRTSPPGPWPFSYGIVSWQTNFGLELGSAKAYTSASGEVYQLGVGRTPRSRSGSIIYEPRSFNLAWVRNGNPLSLAFSVASGRSSTADSVDGGGVAFPVKDIPWAYNLTTGLVRLKN